MAAGAYAVLPNDGQLLTIEDYLPSGVNTFYNPTAGTLLPAEVGDYNIIVVRFTAVPANNNEYLDFGIDIGGTIGIVFNETLFAPKNAGQASYFSYTCPGYSLDTFVANGGIPKIYPHVGNVDIYDIEFQFCRVSSPRNRSY